MSKSLGGKINDVVGKVVHAVGTQNSGKSFGELFEEKKSQLDNLQSSLSSSIFPSFPGQPAGKFTDVGIGIDFHSTVLPPSPMMPVPNVMMVFDIIGAISGCIPPIPPPSEGESESIGALVVRTIVTMMQPSVKVNNQWIANAGTSIQHLPGVFVHGPSPTVAPMAEGEMFMGSSTVLADGSPFSYQYLPSLSCNMVGIPAPFRAKKPNAKPKLSLMAPTISLVNVVPKGLPVLVGGPPTIDLFGMAVNLGLKGFGKLWKHGIGGQVQKLINKISEKHPNLAKFLQHGKCLVFGEPVDVATGRVIAENEEFRFPGAIPLQFNRYYYSDMEAKGALGKGWHHSYDLYHTPPDEDDIILVRIKDGRFIGMPALADGDSFYHPIEKLTWKKTSRGYILEDEDFLSYHFQSQVSGTAHKLTHISNGLGDSIVFQYDGLGRLNAITDTAGRVFELLYKDIQHPHLLTDIQHRTKEGFIWSHHYRYTEEGLLHQVIDVEGAVKTFRYTDGLLTHLTNQLGGNFYWEYEKKNGEARCIHTWGDEGILEYRAEYLPGKTIVTNSLGHTTIYEYDERLLITQITDPQGGVTIYRYNALEERVLAIDPKGNPTKYSYDRRGNLITQTNAYGDSEQYNYDDKDRLISHKSYQGRSFSRSFNELGQIDKIQYPNGSFVELSYQGSHLTEIKDSQDNITELLWDAHHNLVEIIYPNGSHSRMSYDSLGRQTRHIADNGALTQYDYDKVGNVLRLIEPSGNVHHFTYDEAGNVLTAQDHSRKVEFKYWGLGQLKQRTEHGRTLTFTYDTEEQLKSIRNEGGELYRFSRDGNGNIIGEWGFDGLSRSYVRDANGQVVKTKSPLHTTRYGYTPLGQISTVEYSDGRYEWYEYDKDGLLIKGENAENQTLLERDQSGQVVNELQNGHHISQNYNGYGQRTVIESSLGSLLEQHYNHLGQLSHSQASQGDSSLWEADYYYDRMGWEVARELPGEVVQKMVYDRAGRVKEQRIHTHSYEPTRRQYEWNPSHQLERLTVNGKITEFDYDAFGNLAQADYNQTETIYKVPDAIGNLYKDKDRQGYHYGKGGKLLEDPDWKYSYDEEGNLIQKLSKTQKCRRFSLIDDESGNMLMWQYDWRANGNLERVYNNEGLHISFEYDALGRRTAKINEKTKQITRYLWNGNVLLQEWSYALEDRPKLTVDTQGVVSYDRAEPVENLTTWVYKEDSFVPCAKLVDGEYYSIISDHLGTPVQAYNAQGEKVWECELDIYGKVRTIVGGRSFIPFRYQGQYEDEETGLYYNRFRYYSPDSGTYLSQDPIGVAGNNPNFYAYVEDSNTQIDLYGLDVYGLYAESDGWYPVYEKGQKTPTSYQFLKKGELYKIGESKNPDKRYSITQLEEGRIHSPSRTDGDKYKGIATDANGKVRFDANGNTFDAGLKIDLIGPQGQSKAVDRLLETQELKNYKNKNGTLPPGNKTYH